MFPSQHSFPMSVCVVFCPSCDDMFVMVSRLPPILRGLKGSYESIPFGTARAVSGLTSEWESCKSDDSEGPHGGYPANGTWELVSQVVVAPEARFRPDF
jgi:hypothetical protein